MQRQLTDTLILYDNPSDDDLEQLVAFNAMLHSDTGEPDQHVGRWVVEMFERGRHPTVTREDCFYVRDTGSGQIVSMLCLIPQTWTFDGIPFGLGRVELVGTHPDYRRQGLVRAQMDALHERCAAIDLPVQGITGIPYYYRQFGYEYALDLGGGQMIALDLIPDPPGDAPYTLRGWQPADLPRLQALYDYEARGKLITCQRPESHWRYRLELTSEQSVVAQWFYVITHGDVVVGYLAATVHPWGPYFAVRELVIEGEPYPVLVPWLVGRLRAEAATRFKEADPPIKMLYFNLGREHPVFPHLRAYRSFVRSPYGWYIRVADVAAFLRQVGPALEARLAADSALAGLTRTLTIDLYRTALRLTFEAGRLAGVEPLTGHLPEGGGDFSCPPLVFLQALFGYRSLEELEHAYPDVNASPETRPLVETLFPKRLSWVRELD